MNDWRQLAAALADELVSAGKLRSPEWIATIRDTPRHLFVPEYLESDGAGGWRGVDTATSGIASVYENVGRYTLVGPDPHGWGDGPLSSSSTPGLMTRMLESLDIRGGHRVLEIGTGTGYNAALLCHRLGADRVVSVDIEPDLVDVARARLATLGHTPTLVAGDGFDGLPDHAPFDRIIATCSVPHIPRAWIDQLTTDGLLLVDLQPSTAAGNLVLLRRTEDGATGRFLPGWATFMPLRSADHPTRSRTALDATTLRRRSTIGYREPWTEPVWWFLTSLVVPAGIIFGRCGDGVFLDAADGSRAEIVPDSGGADVAEHGPTRLWSRVEESYRQWVEHGCPGWERLGVTVTSRTQRVWLDDDTAGPSWSLGPATQEL